MGSPRKILAIVAMGASLVAVTALGLANPGGGAPGQGEGVKRASPAPLAPGDTTSEPATEDRRALTEGGGCRCCAGVDGACRSTAGDQRTRGAILLAQGNPVPDQQAKSQDKTKKQPKAGKEALAKGVATRKALLDQLSALMEDGVADCCIDPGMRVLLDRGGRVSVRRESSQGRPRLPGVLGRLAGGTGDASRCQAGEGSDPPDRPTEEDLWHEGGKARAGR